MSGPTSPGTPPASLKSAAAFRTIGEVADELGLPQHVLRFWETRFPQIQPMKRGGNRRYYRPADVALLRRIHNMLHAEGYTIKGVQKLLLDGVKPAVVAPAAPVLATGLDIGAIRAIRDRLAAGLVATRA
jgi:hypothetical protein